MTSTAAHALASTSARAAASAIATAAVTTSELSLSCSDGIQLAAQLWKKQQQQQQPTSTESSSAESQASSSSQHQRNNILCLHGWMDNCRSFDLLVPAVLQKLPPTAQLVALDFVGHGWSSHKSADGPPSQLAEHVFYVHQAVQQLDWIGSSSTTANGDTCKFTLMGHSMGAAVSCLYAAAFPEHVEQVVLIEGAGPLVRQADDVAQHVRQHVLRRSAQTANPREPRIYPNLQQAIKVRCQTAQNFPGNQWLSTEAATAMVERGTRTVGNGGVQFRHDPRLQWPSLQYFTAEQVEAMYGSMQQSGVPVALLLADDGWPMDPARAARAVELLQPTYHVTLPGSHHFHADPDTAGDVAEHVLRFLLRDAISSDE